jgi:hypothetical protein
MSSHLHHPLHNVPPPGVQVALLLLALPAVHALLAGAGV